MGVGFDLAQKKSTFILNIVLYMLHCVMHKHIVIYIQIVCVLFDLQSVNDLGCLASRKVRGIYFFGVTPQLHSTHTHRPEDRCIMGHVGYVLILNAHAFVDVVVLGTILLVLLWFVYWSYICMAGCCSCCYPGINLNKSQCFINNRSEKRLIAFSNFHFPYYSTFPFHFTPPHTKELNTSQHQWHWHHRHQHQRGKQAAKPGSRSSRHLSYSFAPPPFSRHRRVFFPHSHFPILIKPSFFFIARRARRHSIVPLLRLPRSLCSVYIGEPLAPRPPPPRSLSRDSFPLKSAHTIQTAMCVSYTNGQLQGTA